MFYLTKKSCSFDVLKIWKFNFLLVLLADLVKGWRDRENPEKVSFFRHWAHWERLSASIKWKSDTFRRNPILKRKSGMKTVYDFLVRDEVPQPQDWSKSGSKLAGSLGGVSISLASIPTIPIPELDIFSAWKIVLLWTRINVFYLICYFLVDTNVWMWIICFHQMQIDYLCSC